MKKVLIIGSKDSGSKNNPEIIARNLQSETVIAEVCFWEDISFEISSKGVSIRTPHGELSGQAHALVLAVGWYKLGTKLIYRDVAFALALYLDAHGIDFWNKEMLHQRSISKLSCLVQLALAGIPVPDTVFSLDNNAVKKYPTPFVAKAASASRGKSNHLISTEEERQEIDMSEAYFLVQPFLPNDHDLRVVCMNSTPQLILRRARQANARTHLNNTSRGGEAKWIELSDIPEDILTNSSKICKIMRRDLAGIDFIPDSSSPFGYSCLEVNAIPQLTSGNDVQKKMDALKKTINEIRL